MDDRHVNVVGEPRLPGPGLVGPALQPAFNVHPLPIGQTLIARLRQLAKRRAIQPLDLFPLLSGAGGLVSSVMSRGSFNSTT